MRPASLVTTFAFLAASAGSAHAGAALDDDGTHQSGVAGAPAPAAAITAPEEAAAPEIPVEYGIGIRLRAVFLPKPILDLFLARVPGGSTNYGYGIDLTRRRGDTELQLGVEYEKITPKEGVWINRGDTVPSDEPDYIVSPDHDNGKSLGWVTLEFTFLHNTPITNWLAFRYGGGAGIGVLTGELAHYNVQCSAGATNENPGNACTPPIFGGTAQYTDPSPGNPVLVAYDLPPVFPVINAIIGFQLKPTDKWTVNIEGGIRTLPFVGLESSYFF